MVEAGPGDGAWLAYWVVWTGVRGGGVLKPFDELCQLSRVLVSIPTDHSPHRYQRHWEGLLPEPSSASFLAPSAACTPPLLSPRGFEAARARRAARIPGKHS